MKDFIEKPGRSITRRDFMKGTALGALSIAMGIPSARLIAETSEVPFGAESPESVITLVRNQAAVSDAGEIDAKVVSEMIDTALTLFSGEKSTGDAWKKYIHAEDTVGIKYTRCSWMRIPTEQAVVDAVSRRVKESGAKKLHAGDGGLPFKECSVLLNVPSVKVHTLTGIAVSLKNYINFSPNPSAYHHEGSEKLGEVWLPVKDKTRLIIVDFLRPYFGPGPQINPAYRWNYNGILVGTDPVAVDTVCLKICQEKRNAFKGEEWLIAPPKSISGADAKYGLGTSDPLKIKVIRSGWDKDTMI
ncbi:MAG: DUF362 domain-containing protein [bacterium]|nr:MAG: DUF362 domain-containing protein [bacterium]